jgi:hypothetical protein
MNGHYPKVWIVAEHGMINVKYVGSQWDAPVTRGAFYSFDEAFRAAAQLVSGPLALQVAGLLE